LVIGENQQDIRRTIRGQARQTNPKAKYKPRTNAKHDFVLMLEMQLSSPFSLYTRCKKGQRLATLAFVLLLDCLAVMARGAF
jgi:hypothetical protein